MLPDQKKHCQEMPITRQEGNVFQPLAVDDVKTTEFVNLTNESEKGMPVILNVFSLFSSYTNRTESTTYAENNFLATPPYSTSSEELEPLKNTSVVRRDDGGSYKEDLPFRYDSDHWSTRALVTPQVNNVKYKSIHQVTSRQPQRITNGFIDLSQTYRKRRKSAIKDQPSIKSVDETTVDPNDFTNRDNISFPNVRSPKFHINKYVAQRRSLTSRRSALPANIKLEKANYISKEKKPPEQQHVIIKRRLLQHINRKFVTKTNLLDDAKNPIGIEHIKSNSIPSSNDKDFQLCGDELKRTLDIKDSGQFQDSKKCASISLTSEVSYMTPDTLSESKNDAEDNDEFLSPRDVKVLQLRKRLQEQELVLKRLRTNH